MRGGRALKTSPFDLSRDLPEIKKASQSRCPSGSKGGGVLANESHGPISAVNV
jgi:hypothetical protein